MYLCSGRTSGCNCSWDVLISGENLGLHGAFQPEAPASHVFFYLSLVEHLEKVVGEVDAVVEGECRDLLTQAGKMIFTNLCLLRNSGALGQAGLRFDAVLEPAQADDAGCTEALQEEVDELVDVLCDRLQRGPGADGGAGPSGEDVEDEARDAAEE